MLLRKEILKTANGMVSVLHVIAVLVQLSYSYSNSITDSDWGKFVVTLCCARKEKIFHCI